jgi:beta-galactosidase
MSTASGIERRAVVVADQRLSVGGETRVLYGGAMHYWRLERERWSPILDEVRRMGFTMISTYIPWEVHERARGDFDFQGNKDIDAFLTLIEEKELDIVVRPGPQINAELTWFGYPLRILADPAMQALNGQGTPAVLTQVPRPIPAVSYAAERFFEETALWYDAICPILAKHAHPNGRLVAAQVDNEMAYFFHVNAYAADFSPASIERYRAFLGARYADIAKLNETYGSAYAGFEQVEPPRRFEAGDRSRIPWYTDWIAYREHYLVDAIRRLGDMMRQRGLDGIALFHNYPHPLGPGGSASGFTTPFDLSGLEQHLDWVGFDVYSRKELYEHVRTVLSYVVGTSRFPYIPEFIAGVWPWYLQPGDIADEEFVTKAALMQGVKGFSRYMLVERDRWLDSPIRSDGRVRDDHAAMFRRANDVAIDAGFVGLRRRADVLLLANREYDRLEAAAVLVGFPGDFLETPSGFSEYPTFMTVAEDDLGFAEPIQLAKTEWFACARGGLAQSGFAHLLSDTALPAERLQAYKAVVVSSFEFMSADLQRKLLGFANAGGTVVLGPRLPHLDEHMRAYTLIHEAVDGSVQETLEDVATVALTGRGRIVHVTDFSDPAEVFHRALDGLDLLRFERNDPRLDVTVHTCEDGARLVVYVANPTAEAISAEVTVSPVVTFVRELWEDRDVGMDGTLEEELPPYTIRIYECRR